MSKNEKEMEKEKNREINKNLNRNCNIKIENENEFLEKIRLDRDLLNEFENPSSDKHKKFKKSKSFYSGKKDFIKNDSYFNGMRQKNKSASDLLNKKNFKKDNNKDLDFPNVDNFEEKNDANYERKKSEELIDFEIQKICERIHDQEKIKKATKTNNLFDYELEKRRYEEHIREKFANVSQSPSLKDDYSSAANNNPILIKDEKKDALGKNEFGGNVLMHCKGNKNVKQDGNFFLSSKKRKSSVHHIR